MKRFLQEVVWRLSLVAALLTCASLAAWGQEPENPDEGTTEKVMHKIYDYEKRFGYPMCVGCGRCDDVCPEYISFSGCVNHLEEAMAEVTEK